jgi:hypothetical protein
MLRASGLLFVGAIYVVSVSCATAKASRPPSLLNALMDASRSSDDREAYTALFLLAHTSMTERENAQFVAEFNGTKDPMRRLALAYVITVRFQSRQYEDAFVDLYPVGRDQARVWDLPTSYVEVPSPLERHLAFVAKTNPRALEKLVSGVPFADGAHAEFLVEELRRIGRYQPQLVREALQRANVPPSRIGLSTD